MKTGGITMKLHLWVIAFFLFSHSVSAQPAKLPGEEAILSSACSMTSQYALAGAALQDMAYIKSLIEGEATPDRSRNICESVERVHAFSTAIVSLTKQEQEFGSTLQFNASAATNFTRNLVKPCLAAAKRGKDIELTPEETAKIKDFTERLQKHLVKVRAGMIEAEPRLFATVHGGTPRRGMESMGGN